MSIMSSLRRQVYGVSQGGLPKRKYFAKQRDSRGVIHRRGEEIRDREAAKKEAQRERRNHLS